MRLLIPAIAVFATLVGPATAAYAAARQDLSAAAALSGDGASASDPEASRALMGGAFKESSDGNAVVVGAGSPGAHATASAGGPLQRKGLHTDAVPAPKPGRGGLLEPRDKLVLGGMAAFLGGALAGNALAAHATEAAFLGAAYVGAGIGLAAFALFATGHKKAGAGTAVGGLIGLALGGPVGGVLGAALGGLGAHYIGKLFHR